MKNLSTMQSNALGVSHSFKHRLKLPIALWLRNYRTRKALKGMELHRLDDVGIDAAQAEDERLTPFWQ